MADAPARSILKPRLVASHSGIASTIAGDFIAGFNPSAGDHVDLGVEKLLEIPLKAGQSEQPDIGVEIDQQVDVAVLGVLAPSNDPEHPDVAGTAPLGV